MEKDLFYFLPVEVQAAYNAFLAAASGEKFRASCWQEPYHKISFSMKFSFKYNINGGTCTMRFMPTQGGTLVNIHFSILQLVLAMYKRMAQDLVAEVTAQLGVPAQEVQATVAQFDSPAAQVRPQYPDMDAPVPRLVCKSCGAQLPHGAAFCTVCGTKFVPDTPASVSSKRICSACGAESLEADAIFCVCCGAKFAVPACCKTCGEPLVADALFCIKCGTKQ